MVSILERLQIFCPEVIDLPPERLQSSAQKFPHLKNYTGNKAVYAPFI
jgi:hypothetical protein